MSQTTILRFPNKWKKTKTSEGTLYEYVTDKDTRTCLIKNDRTAEIRANGFISNYPSEEEIASLKDIKELLEIIQKARVCVGKNDGYDCENILFPVADRTNTLCLRCPGCRKRRMNYYQNRRRQRDRVNLVGVSEKEKICVVDGCPGLDSVTIRTYPIPASDIEAWCANLKLNISAINEDTRICSRHFEETCKTPKSLKLGARPTLNLGHNDISFQNCKVMTFKNKRVCCIVGCNTTSPPHRVHSFPTDTERLKQWLLICVIKNEMFGNKHKFICEKHFDSSMFTKNKRYLKSDAVPKMDAVSWIKNNTNVDAPERVAVLKTAESTPKKRLKQIEPEIQALNEIQNALVVKVETHPVEVEDAKSDSDLLDSLQCRNVCLTCAKAFKDCETYRQGCCELEQQSQDLQAQIDELQNEIEILMSELQSDYTVYQEDQ